MEQQNYIGTSGYVYPYWKGRFYPDGLASSKWLTYYSEQFKSLELNGTFYRFPTLKAQQNNRLKVGNDFLFTVKAHKIITHTLRLKDAKEKIAEFMAIVKSGLDDKLGCVLYQLPPSFAYSQENLAQILSSLDGQENAVVEFRNQSWWDESVFTAFRNAGITFCNASYPGLPDTSIITSDTFYKRMHGIPKLFQSGYSDAELKSLAYSIPKAEKIFVYFNNTTFGHGFENALYLKSLLDAKS